MAILNNSLILIGSAVWRFNGIYGLSVLILTRKQALYEQGIWLFTDKKEPDGYKEILVGFERDLRVVY